MMPYSCEYEFGFLTTPVLQTARDKMRRTRLDVIPCLVWTMGTQDLRLQWTCKPQSPHICAQETLEVAIKAGWKEGTRIIFEGKGDRLPGRPPQDIVFVVQELPHTRFTRAGDDLVTQVCVPVRRL